jgi:hypothetical protein
MTSEPAYKVLCSKDHVILKYKRYPTGTQCVKNTFLIDFEMYNPSPTVNMERFCSFNIFKLIFEVNRNDAIEELTLDEYDDDASQANMTMLFKRKGEDFGMKQKYLSLHINFTKSGTNYVFEGEPTPTSLRSNNDNTLEQIKDASSVFCMSLLSPDKIRVQFMLSLPVPTVEQPSYIEQNLGFIMKKVLSRTKTFIEAMK